MKRSWKLKCNIVLPSDNMGQRMEKAPFAVARVAAPLRQQVLDELRRAIIDGEIAPGSRLVERDLCARMGVSRTVVREVLRQLESEGLVGMIPHRGPVVRALSLDEARELYAIRAVLEGLAARIFATDASAAQVDRLLRTVEASRRHVDESVSPS